jgi:hypothetical protein
MLTKIGRTAWQNRSDSKNRTDFGCSCKRGVTKCNCVENPGEGYSLSLPWPSTQTESILSVSSLNLDGY